MTGEGRYSPSPVLDITCPRCGNTVQERFYGPCTHCRADLRATHGGEARDVQAEAYVPKMNVVPNQVALKD